LLVLYSSVFAGIQELTSRMAPKVRPPRREAAKAANEAIAATRRAERSIESVIEVIDVSDSEDETALKSPGRQSEPAPEASGGLNNLDVLAEVARELAEDDARARRAEAEQRAREVWGQLTQSIGMHTPAVHYTAVQYSTVLGEQTHSRRS
jgi:hypothetical protein